MIRITMHDATRAKLRDALNVYEAALRACARDEAENPGHVRAEVRVIEAKLSAAFFRCVPADIVDAFDQDMTASAIRGLLQYAEDGGNA
jgi:hypothetical protein